MSSQVHRASMQVILHCTSYEIGFLLPRVFPKSVINNCCDVKSFPFFLSSSILDGCLRCKWEMRFDVVAPLYANDRLHKPQVALSLLRLKYFQTFDLLDFRNGKSLLLLLLSELVDNVAVEHSSIMYHVNYYVFT